MRIDQWLWAVRVYHSRSIAAESVKRGKVQVAASPVKPAHMVHPGEVVTAEVGSLVRKIKVLAIPAARLSAKLVPAYAEELTDPAAYEEARRNRPLRPSFYQPR